MERAADGKLFFTTPSCKVAVILAGIEWKQIALNDLEADDGECHSTPAIVGGKIYIRTHGALMAFGEGK